MPNTALTVEQVLILLAETPTRLAALTVDLSSEALQLRPTPDEWSANEVLAHLRACADVWGNYTITILTEDQPTLRAVSPRTWIKKTNYPELEFRPSLAAFTTQRTALLAVLEPLPLDAWSRSATVKAAGKVREQTVLSYTERLVSHEQPHIKQIADIVNTIHASKDAD